MNEDGNFKNWKKNENVYNKESIMYGIKYNYCIMKYIFYNKDTSSETELLYHVISLYNYFNIYYEILRTNENLN